MTILDKGWERTQIKVFSRWCAKHLATKGIKFESVLDEFADGVKLIQLLEIIGKEPITGKWHQECKNRYHMIENVGMAIDYITNKKGIKLVNISPDDIVDKNTKLTLGLTWSCINKFAIEDISVEEATARAALLIWCQKNTQGYEGVNVTNFTTSWSSGLAFCALINRFRPNLLDYNALDKSDHTNNCATAFKACEEIGLTVYLDPEDLVDITPDEKSVVTQVAEFFHFFASESKVEQQAEKLKNVIAIQKEISALKDEYVAKANEFIAAVDSTKAQVTSEEYGCTVPEVKDKLIEVINYSRGVRPGLVDQKAEALRVWSQLLTKCNSNNRPAPSYPEGLEAETLNDKLVDMDNTAAQYVKSIRDELRKVQQALLDAYDAKCKEFSEWTQKVMEESSNLQGELEEKRARLVEINNEIEEKKQTVSELNEPYAELEKYDLQLDAEQTPDSVESMFTTLSSHVANILASIDAAIAAAKGLEITEEQLAEFRETFQTFDKDNSGTLQYYELNACLTALGETATDDECKEIINKYTGGAETLDFDNYVKFMLERFSKAENKDTTIEAFRAIAQNNPVVTEAQLQRFFSDEEVEYLKSQLQEVDGGYDFASWVESIYA
ncbi:putative alpha-actinin [Histomonas meleagridis]|uniref:Putative alpha-actinin n=1 Tax=Histomonas meleagridis TaxID=135588 RepID=B9W422_HISME|nr:putative alpha-actinin [Histomonas meleagridis]CAQ86679.2 putative alpha-actinin [Histomonas meleagridis]